MKIESSERGFEYGVRHLRSSDSIALQTLLQMSLDLKPNEVEFLVTFGSIYVDGERLLQMPTEPLKPAALVRVHTKPRRFPMSRLNLKQIVFENDDFLVFDKPSGIPVHATVDNLHENLLSFLQVTVPFSGRIRPEKGTVTYFTTHRLDVATSGLLVVAKTQRFQKVFNQVIADRRTQKIYRVLSHGQPLKVGPWVHYMEPSPRAPKTVVRDEKETYLRCELEVLNSHSLQPGVTESRVQLRTGRTHQIRAQFAAEQCPVVGDLMYGSHLKLTQDQADAICLQASELQFELPSGKKFEFKLDHSPWSDRTQGLMDRIENHLKASLQ